VGTKRAIVVTNPIVEERVLGQPTVAIFDVLLTRPSSERITLAYQTVDQSARAGVDYVARSGSLVFEAGQTRASVVVPILSDTLLEAAETFLLRIVPPYPAQIAASAPAAIGTATIADSSITGTANSDVLRAPPGRTRSSASAATTGSSALPATTGSTAAPATTSFRAGSATTA
jgi:hypothetical protein